MDQGFDEFPGPASTGPDARIDGAPCEDILRSERVDFEKADELDDLAIGGDLIRMVRLERMAGNHFWGAIYMRDGRDLRLSFWVEKRSLAVTAEWEGRSEATKASPVDDATRNEVERRDDPLSSPPQQPTRSGGKG